jgi:hypothetical protein
MAWISHGIPYRSEQSCQASRGRARLRFPGDARSGAFSSRIVVRLALALWLFDVGITDEAIPALLLQLREDRALMPSAQPLVAHAFVTDRREIGPILVAITS